VDTIIAHVNLLSSDYARATANRTSVNGPLLVQAISEAKKAHAAATSMYHTMATTPILLLRSQTWLDQHNIRVDLHSKFGDAATQISNQGTLILDNAITILSKTATILLDMTLILIISFFLLNDGGRLMRQGIALVPANYREQVWFFISSLDKVVGGYIRGQLFLSLLAGILGGGGAALLGVPYPLLIGIVTFLLQSIPVIGPMVAIVPAVAISLFFMPLLTTVVLAAWFVVFQQIVTNVLGPRIMGMAVGIHPLEALLAVLVGFPLGGFLGAFLAVPVAGIVHILLREAYAYFVLGRSLPTATVPIREEPETPPLTEPAAAGHSHDPAAGPSPGL
jgi:predicted PurR-regulated permease PerM